MKLRVDVDGHVRDVVVDGGDSGSRVRFTIDGEAFDVDAVRIGAGTWSLVFPDGRQRLITVTGSAASGFRVNLPSGSAEVRVDRRRGGRRAVASDAAAGPATLVAPMPGRVTRVLAVEGQNVQAGEGVLVIEAMKMENELQAPRDGVLRHLHVREGDAVEAGARLAVIA